MEILSYAKHNRSVKENVDICFAVFVTVQVFRQKRRHEANMSAEKLVWV